KMATRVQGATGDGSRLFPPLADDTGVPSPQPAGRYPWTAHARASSSSQLTRAQEIGNPVCKANSANDSGTAEPAYGPSRVLAPQRVGPVAPLPPHRGLSRSRGSSRSTSAAQRGAPPPA